MPVSLKPDQALALWHKVCRAQMLGTMPDLTVRQMTILLTIYLQAPPHTVRGLATALNVTKPVITRALDTMGAMKLVDRHRDPKDRRNMIITRTVEGTLLLDKLSDLIIDHALELP